MNAVLLLIVFTAPAGLKILVEKKLFSGLFENPDPIPKNYKGLKNKDRLFSDKIKNKTIQILEKKGFFEYFSCKSGQPMGAKNFSWSAALYLDLKLNKN